MKKIILAVIGVAILTACSQPTPKDEPQTPVIQAEGFFLGGVKIWTGCWKGDRIYWRQDLNGGEQLQVIDNDPTCAS